jgi:hypothetical protein
MLQVISLTHVKGITTLTRHSFDSPSDQTSRNALRCLCNALFLKPETRQIFVDLGYEAKACDKLKKDNRDDEFLVSRLIFLTTYGTTVNLVTLIDEYGLADTIIQNLQRHATRPKGSKDAMEDMALFETLKLLFNVAHHTPERASSFDGIVPHIVTLLNKQEGVPAAAPLAPPSGLLINALMNLNLNSDEAKASFYPKSEPTLVSKMLLNLLGRSIESYGDEDLEQTVTPLVTVINGVHDEAPDEVREYIRSQLLPTEEDRKKVLGEGGSLSAILLKNTTNPMTPEFRNAASHLFFAMSDKDPSKFVDNVGFGFASGFLFQNNLPMPESTGAGSVGNKPFNPVTGQFLDEEKLPDLPEMTDEEKELEAERLFVLFERYAFYRLVLCRSS